MSDKAKAIEFIENYREFQPPLPEIKDENIRNLIWACVGNVHTVLDEHHKKIEDI